VVSSRFSCEIAMSRQELSARALTPARHLDLGSLVAEFCGLPGWTSKCVDVKWTGHYQSHLRDIDWDFWDIQLNSVSEGWEGFAHLGPSDRLDDGISLMIHAQPHLDHWLRGLPRSRRRNWRAFLEEARALGGQCAEAVAQGRDPLLPCGRLYGRSGHVDIPAVGVLVAVGGELKGQIFELRDGENQLGRQHDCEVQLVERRVSRRHARILHREGLFVIEPLNDRNPTFLNGEPTTGSELMDGDLIRLGRTLLRFRPVVAPQSGREGV
jgi:hypothetical protein